MSGCNNTLLALLFSPFGAVLRQILFALAIISIALKLLYKQQIKEFVEILRVLFSRLRRCREPIARIKMALVRTDARIHKSSEWSTFAKEPRLFSHSLGQDERFFSIMHRRITHHCYSCNSFELIYCNGWHEYTSCRESDTLDLSFTLFFCL